MKLLGKKASAKLKQQCKETGYELRKAQEGKKTLLTQLADARHSAAVYKWTTWILVAFY